MKTESTNGPHLVYSSRTPGRVRDRWPKELSLLRMSMNALGVRLMRLEYDGCEGEGEFLAPRLMDGEFKEITATLKDHFQQQVETFFHSLLESRYGEWAAGEGACGDFGIDFKFGTVVHVHRSRYRTTQYDTTRVDGFSAEWPDAY
ncbi:hypothetical protein GCM10011487_44860 [Steroidobacter agaridevorans]|uniref:Uncharacterized protein n=1 Tax=Steroidobacter agaridevorans TaxID=2695856 RepID=A0A829YIZ2_9GAMM|nr:hypothetical protein [Steroidobacter agaridevorans]GFE82486.1 hypothetical protein GCM10011487_44860 [Steroidobacter agaridevorans]